MRHPNIDRLRQLRLYGMAKALEERDHQPDREGLSLDELVALLIEREAEERADTAFAARLKRARLRQQACLEDLDTRPGRGLDRARVRELCKGRSESPQKCRGKIPQFRVPVISRGGDRRSGFWAAVRAAWAVAVG